jgi:ubiquinone/menaquinone biosynthesis C-methylase UbiE
MSTANVKEWAPRQVDHEDSLTIEDLSLVLFGHAAFQYLNAGCELGVFELLSRQPGLSKRELADRLKLQAQPARCLMFGLTALRLVVKSGDTYRNSSAIEKFFEERKWKEFHDTVRFEARIVYLGQSDFVESLRQNKNIGLRHIPGSSKNLYERLGENDELHNVFYEYMSSWSTLANPLLLENVDFSRMRSVVDVGGGDATNAIAIAKAFPALHITLIDIPASCERARQRIAAHSLSDRIEVVEGDMFADDFPSGYDCFMFIHQLVIWPLDVNTWLLKKAYDALAPGGSVLIFNSISSDEEDGPVMAALDSVYFVSIPAEGGMIYAWREYEQCLRDAGFSDIKRIESDFWTPHGIIVATK